MGLSRQPRSWAHLRIHKTSRVLPPSSLYRTMFFVSLQQIQGIWSHVSATHLSAPFFLNAILQSLITTKIALWRVQTVLGQIAPPRLRSRLRPRDLILLCQCLLAITMMFLCHVKATHITDYSEVSGFYGPGTFWAWILVCAMAFGPNEGRVLLRHIWSGPIVGLEHACIFDPDILDLPRPQDMEDGSVESSDRDLDTRHEIDREKLCRLRRLLDSIFSDAFVRHKGKPKLTTKVVHFFLQDSDISLWRYYPPCISSTEFNYRLHKNYEKATGERAEHILDLNFGSNMSVSKCQSGFVEYHSQGLADTNDLYHLFFKEISAAFPWLRMEFDDFHHHLIDLRNRFQYLQYRRELRELSPRLDANTCAAIAYPLIACCVQLSRHVPFQNQRWEAQDEAVASVAQLSSTISFFAIMSNRPSFNHVTLRHVAWMTVLLCSLKVLSCRVHYVCVERSFSNQVALF